MAHKFAEIAFTPTVRKVQSQAGSRNGYAAMDHGEDHNHEITEREATFIAERDSFYMASVSETGWPYVQHRGGPLGFMKVLDAKRIGFADYAGNRQYVSTGNFRNDNRVALFFMDYPNQRRLKLLGRVETVEDRETCAALQDPEYLATVERGFVVHVEAFDWNCPQHITPRYTEAQIRTDILPTLRGQLAREAGVAPADSGAAVVSDGVETEAAALGDGPLELVVTGMRQLTARVRGFELRAPDGSELPSITAGSHLRVPMRLSSGRLVEREYSIASDPAIRDRYEIGVLREDDGRGGSTAVHQTFALGTTLKVDLPTNLFALHEDERPAVLIAGGIGITPIRSMAYALKARGTDFALHYAGRNRRDMAFVEELEETFGSRVHACTSVDQTRLDVAATLTGMPADAVVFTCGPTRLIEEVVSAARTLGIPADRVRFERFAKIY